MKKIICFILLTVLFVVLLPAYADAPIVESNIKITPLSGVGGIKISEDYEIYDDMELNRQVSFDDFTPVPEENYYGRSYLASLENSEALLWLYNEFHRLCENFESYVNVKDSGYTIRIHELNLVEDAFRNDYAQYEIGELIYKWVRDEKKEYCVTEITRRIPEYYTREQMRELDSLILGVIEKSGVEKDMSDYEKTVRLHDAIIKSVDYDMETSIKDEQNIYHTAYGALKKGRAVCDGYAKAYQYALYKVGVKSHIVTGFAQTSVDHGENHAWNLVWIDGNTYLTDITWDDQGEIIYSYFNLTSEEMGIEHAEIYNECPIPECTKDDMTYYAQNPDEAVDVNGLKKALSKQFETSYYARVYFLGTYDEYFDWCNQNIGELFFAKYPNADPEKYYIRGYYNGNEYFLVMAPDYKLEQKGKTKIEITSPRAGAKLLIQAFYDENNVLCATNMQYIRFDGAETKEVSIDAHGVDYKTVKFYLWENTTYISPLVKS